MNEQSEKTPPEKTPLRVLFVEDEPDDATLMIRVLKRAGFDPAATRVDTAQAMRAALTQSEWDVVLCDHTMPGFDSRAALALLRECGVDTPLLVVSGSVGEELAAEYMRLGAVDVLLKDNMQLRLVPAVRRELAAAEIRRRAAESEQRARDVAEIAGHWIWETDSQHRFSFISEDTSGRQAINSETALGRTRWQLDGVNEDETLWRRHRAALDAREVLRDFQYSLTNASGQISYVRVTGKPIYDRNGIFVGYRGSSVDETVIVETRQRADQAEALLHQAQKMEAVGQLTGGLAHDFNNLLLVIISNLDLLLEDQRDDPTIQEFASEARDAGHRGADLIRSLLAFSRQQPLRPVETDVNQLVGDITKLLGRTLDERIKISLDFNPEIWPVLVDPAQLQTTIANLATNARDAMPKGGQVKIRTVNTTIKADRPTPFADVPPGDYALIEVSDTGTGMTPEIMARIFEPFFTTKRRSEGTGLGLSMVFGFVKQSGGHVAVTSKLGAGTTIRLFLPRHHQAPKLAEKAVAQPGQSGNGETILVVEDDQAIRRMVSRVLTRGGYIVHGAEHANAAIAELESGLKIDLIFSDIIMAGEIDGFDLARITTDRWPSLPIVLTSGFPDRDMDRIADLPRAIELLPKPYSQDQLTRTLRDALDRDRVGSA